MNLFLFDLFVNENDIFTYISTLFQTNIGKIFAHFQFLIGIYDFLVNLSLWNTTYVTTNYSGIKHFMALRRRHWFFVNGERSYQ